jgi:hypothetical protein
MKHPDDGKLEKLSASAAKAPLVDGGATALLGAFSRGVPRLKMSSIKLATALA